MSDCYYCGSKCRKTTVYVIGERVGAPTVKVGYAGNAGKRLTQLRKATGRDLNLLGRVVASCEFKAMDIEEASHRLLRPYWSGRGEWFECDAETAISTVETVAARFGKHGRKP